MTNGIKCEKCGSMMEFVKQEHPQGMICPHCSYGLVTSYIEPIALDQTAYELTISKYENVPSTQELKAINAVMPSKNLLRLRKEIIATDYILKDQAREILRIAKMLKKVTSHFLSHRIFLTNTKYSL